MHRVLPYFPLSASVGRGDAKSFVISLIIYLVASGVLGVLSAVLGWIPLVGWALDFVFSLLGIYCVAGIVLSIYQFVRED